MQWDFKDQLLMTQRQAVNASDTDGTQHQGERTYYVYDAAGQRVRKTTESAAGIKTKERFYLGGFEVYREYDAGGNVTLERETLHVMDDKQRVALVETKTMTQRAAELAAQRHPLPVRQSPRHGVSGARRNRGRDFVRRVLPLRQHVVSGRTHASRK